MCGIAGLLHLDGARPASREVVEAMADTLVHRGPDGEGFFVEGPLALGHRRLAIIDLSTGDQPMASLDGRAVIVYNGEIYNYLEVRAELERLGHHFRTRSDTEVVLEAYLEWGPACLERLNGMFALALWDVAAKRLFLARDRLGEKPLFYSVHGDTFYFASEPKALFAAGVPRALDRSLLDVYLALTYVPAPRSFFRDVQKLPPGHLMIVEAGKVSTRPYWQLPHPPLEAQRTDEARILEEFEALFRDAVRIRLRSDVPLGAFLSGGLDSASVVAEMAAILPRPVESFTIGFEERAFDERALARAVAERFHTTHVERVVEPGDAEQLIDQVAARYDEPFGDSSALPTGIVSQIARERVKVALTGDGGDEVLSGYTIHQGERFSRWWGHVPRELSGHVPRLLGLAGHVAPKRTARARKVVGLATAPFLERLEGKQSGVSPAVRRALVDGGEVVPVRALMEELLRPVRGQDSFSELDYWLRAVSLPDDMLTKVDRASMAASLETRVPFLDHRLVELMASVHMDIKLRGLTRKHVLRATIGRRLPPVLLRQKKRGFGVPLGHWLSGQGERLLVPRARRVAEAGWIDGRALEGELERHRAGETDASVLLWCLAMLSYAL